ncbi:MAG: c-type cytochrome [Spirosomataceae bacterium]
MERFLKWVGIILLLLVVLMVSTAVYLVNSFENRLTKQYEVNPAAIAIPTDSASVAEGKRLVEIHCTGCHGKDVGGTPFFEDASLGSIPASNLTKGQGGKGSVYTEADFVRAIRHGIKKDGTPAFIMPSKEFQHLSDQDLGSIVAYLQSVPAVDKTWPAPNLTFIAKALAGAGAFGDVINAEHINHETISVVKAPVKAVTAEYGGYLVQISGCRSCHGEQLNGSQGNEPGAPVAPNLTAGGKWGKWTTAQFLQTIRTGTTPDHRKIDPKFMPYEGFRLMSDDELTAIYKYIQSQPKLADAIKP